MKFSNNYIFYPDNNELIHAIKHFKHLLDKTSEVNFSPDKDVDHKDNSLHTNGHFEQYLYSKFILDQAATRLKQQLNNTSFEQSPTDWISLQNSLGNIYGALAQREKDDSLYENAMACFNQALEKITQQNSPLDWATAQFNLGTTALALGKQQSDPKLMKVAVDAFTNALLEWTRENNPEQWSATMFQLGSAFYVHGLMLKGNRTFQKSVVAFKNALVVLDADNHALGLAAIHNYRAVVLHHLGESEENTDRVEEAIRSYETAHTICMEQQLPIHLAVICRINKATAHASIARLNKDARLADDTADDFEIILEAFSRSLMPDNQAHCEQQLKELRAFSV